MDENVIHELIHEIDGYKVMLDFDLAKLYGGNYPGAKPGHEAQSGAFPIRF